MISSHTIKSKNIVVKKREREKTVNIKQHIKQPAASDIFQKGRQNGSKNKLMPIKKDGSVILKTQT